MLNCPTCGKTFANSCDITRHLETHKSKEIRRESNQCAQCPKAFLNSKSLRNHIKYQHLQKNQDVTCDICHKVFCGRGAMRLHKDTQHPNSVNDSLKVYTCKFCSESFSMLQGLRIHTDKNHVNYPCTVSNCKSTFRRKGSLMDHLKRHDPNREKVECPKCHLFYLDIRSHMSTSHPRNPVGISFPCNVPLCDKTFSMKKNLYDHQRRAHVTEDDKRFQCQFCDKRWVSKFGLSRHILTHTNEKHWNCKQCGNAWFATSGGLQQHIRNIHQGGNKVEKETCPHCHKTFPTKGRLNAHVKSTHAEKIYKCDVESCSKVFRAQYRLKNHMDTFHLKIRPYKCSFCKFTASSLGNLYCHVRLHTGEKLGSCYFCGKSFTTRYGVIMHLRRIHVKEKWYTCSCGRRFYNNSDLNQHRHYSHCQAV